MEWKHDVTWSRMTNATPTNSTLVPGALTPHVLLVLCCCAGSFKHATSCRPSKDKRLQGKLIEPWYLQIITAASENCIRILKKPIGIKTPHTNWTGREADFLMWSHWEQKRKVSTASKETTMMGRRQVFPRAFTWSTVPFLSSLTSTSTNGAYLSRPCSETMKLCLMGIPGLHLKLFCQPLPYNQAPRPNISQEQLKVSEPGIQYHAAGYPL